VRRLMTMAAVAPLVLATLLLPPVHRAGAELGPPTEAGDTGGGFHGFAAFDTHAQAQIVTVTGYLNAFREDDSVVGSTSEINGPPANSRNIAAFVERGQAATFVYGVIGGPGGARGTLPDPPPGEANAFYPTSDPPYEMTWSGPITGAGFPQVVDSRFHAKGSATPTGRADGAVTTLSDPGYFTVGQATVVSHTEPVEGGVAAEGVSVVHQLQVGPLLIQNIVSRAYAFVPTSGDPKGIATTVIDGATVGNTPVQITDKGVVVTDKTNSLDQDKVNKALADAGYPQVRLIPSIAEARDNGQSMYATAGTLEFVKQDQKFGASNPQGFSGGGFSIGGAAANVSTHRCSPDCGGGEGGTSSGSDTGSAPLPSQGYSSAPAEPASPSPTTAAGTESDSGGTGSGGSAYGADSATLTTDTSGAGLGGSSSSAASEPSGSGIPDASAGYGSTTATSPAGGENQVAAAPAASGQAVGQQAAAAVTPLGPKTADWVRDLYLMAGLALGIVFVGQRLARAFS